MGAALSSTDEGFLADAPLDVLRMLQFQDFPDLYLVLVRMQLPGEVALVRLLLRSEHGVVEQPLQQPWSERRLEAAATMFADEGGGSVGIPSGQRSSEFRYWCIDGSCLWILVDAQHVAAQFIVSARPDDDVAMGGDAGAAFGLHSVRRVPDWAQVLDAARHPLSRQPPTTAAHTRGWPTTDPERGGGEPYVDLVASMALSRRRHRMSRERSTEAAMSRRYDAGAHPISGARGGDSSEDSDPQEGPQQVALMAVSQ